MRMGQDVVTLFETKDKVIIETTKIRRWAAANAYTLIFGFIFLWLSLITLVIIKNY